uniref:THAP-type domain-containing protein n=1 Tax=Photinus pyralis TaxID=7054 RepID=A0A1Y1LJ18_PHOPY
MPPKTVKTYICSYQNCKEKKEKGKHFSFFKFPIKNNAIVNEWKKNCGNINIWNLDNSELCNKILCEKHFLPEHIITLQKRKILRKNAVPQKYSEGKLHYFDYLFFYTFVRNFWESLIGKFMKIFT